MYSESCVLQKNKKKESWNFRKHVLFFSFKKGCHDIYRIVETKLVCAISRKFVFGWKTILEDRAL